MLVIIKIALVMLVSCSVSTQSFAHDKSSSISQFISDKLKHLQNLLRYLRRIVTSTFKSGASSRGGCGGWFPSQPSDGGGGRCSLSGVFPTIFLTFKWFIIWSIIINTINFVFIIIPQTSWWHRIILTRF